MTKRTLEVQLKGGSTQSLQWKAYNNVPYDYPQDLNKAKDYFKKVLLGNKDCEIRLVYLVDSIPFEVLDYHGGSKK
jgi:hypothetical protein